MAFFSEIWMKNKEELIQLLKDATFSICTFTFTLSDRQTDFCSPLILDSFCSDNIIHTHHRLISHYYP